MYKPWQKEYDQLLSQLVEQFEGEILPVKSEHSDQFSLGMSAEMYAYPRFKGTVDGLSVFMEITATPGFDGYILATANVEYLRIYVLQQTHHKMFIRHEGIVDKVQKKLALNYEHETGNEQFDNEYYLYHTSQDDIPILDDSEFQTFVSSLEPFDSFEVSHGGLVVCDEINGKEILTVDHIMDRISKISSVTAAIH